MRQSAYGHWGAEQAKPGAAGWGSQSFGHHGMASASTKSTLTFAPKPTRKNSQPRHLPAPGDDGQEAAGGHRGQLCPPTGDAIGSQQAGASLTQAAVHLRATPGDRMQQSETKPSCFTPKFLRLSSSRHSPGSSSFIQLLPRQAIFPPRIFSLAYPQWTGVCWAMSQPFPPTWSRSIEEQFRAVFFFK